MVIVFKTKPSILASSVVAGPTEKNSVFTSYIDQLVEDDYLSEKTHEKAQSKLIQEACRILLEKAKLERLSVDYFLSGDLINQMTPTNFAARELAIAFIGLFSACATSVSSMIIASILTELGASEFSIAGASSHHNSTEKQFRYPLLYGGQKPATSQWTVTAAGYCLIGKQEQKQPTICAATVGTVQDYQSTDPFHMGEAMAPAAFDTIKKHLKGRNQTLDDYDLIMTGDLGQVGLSILQNLLCKEYQRPNIPCLRDAGAEFYGEDTFFQAGASGAGCSAAVFLGYGLEQLKIGRCQRVLFVATGALLSPLTFQQNESIPSIAHAIEVEMEAKK